MTREGLNQIVDQTFDCAFRVHTALGPGLLESSYKACLAFELAKFGLSVQIEVPVPLIYEGQKLADVGYRVDILVENELIVEIKSVDVVIPTPQSSATFISTAFGQTIGSSHELQYGSSQRRHLPCS